MPGQVFLILVPGQFFYNFGAVIILVPGQFFCFFLYLRSRTRRQGCTQAGSTPIARATLRTKNFFYNGGYVLKYKKNQNGGTIMPKRKKLKLEELKIESFTTSKEEEKKAKGGWTANAGSEGTCDWTVCGTNFWTCWHWECP